MSATPPKLALQGELKRLPDPSPEPTDGIRFQEMLAGAENRRIDTDVLSNDYQRGLGLLYGHLDALTESIRLHELEATVAISLGRHNSPLYVADIHRINGAVRDLLESLPMITALPHRSRA